VPTPLGEAAVQIENPKSEIENGEPASCSPPPALAPLSAEGTGCAAWMRLTGLYPWKPMSLTERRESLDRLIRHARHWFTIRKASGAFRPLLRDTAPAHPNGEAAAVAPIVNSKSSIINSDPASPAPRPPSQAVDPLDAQLFETLHDAVTIAEPSYELAQELEISEAKLNQLCRERSGLSAREWWDVSRAPDALKLIRAEIESALDGAVLDRTNQIRKRGVQLEDLHRALRQYRRAKASSAAERAYNLGFRTPARLNWALWVATRKTMQQHEAEILKEIFQTWSYNHHSCSLIAKNAEAEFNPQYERTKPNYPSNPVTNKETTIPGPSQAPTPAHEFAA
jgi:AraC-like DNA-binding protein